MAELQAIKRRLRSVRNTRQITKAMQMVAASKLRHAQAAAEAPAAYLEAVRGLVGRLSADVDAARHPFYTTPASQDVLAIVIAGDRGLAGAYNSNVFRALAELHSSAQGSVRVITVGKRSSRQVARYKELDELAAYIMDTSDADTGLARPVLREATELFLSGNVGTVELISTRFKSSSVQVVETRRLLPVQPIAPSEHSLKPTLEPNLTTVLTEATERLLEGEVYQAVVEARASEQAARMLAMMNATDNAGDLIDDLTLARNNARQAAITQELAEISGGAEAVSSTN